MTLDEAIKHCLEKAEEKKKEADYFDVPYGMDTSERTSCLDCANDHLQLAEWLKELKEWRDLKLIAMLSINVRRQTMNNDLISREALKEKFDEYIKANPNISGIFELGKVIIDNAPTVDTNEPTLNESIAFHNGYELGKSERPHGKWIFRSGVTCGGYYKCSNCGEVERAEKNYCPNCGADMREEADNE